MERKVSLYNRVLESFQGLKHRECSIRGTDNFRLQIVPHFELDTLGGPLRTPGGLLISDLLSSLSLLTVECVKTSTANSMTVLLKTKQDVQLRRVFQCAF